MTAIGDLLAVGLLEKDTNDDVLWTWSYPSVSRDQSSLILRKWSLDDDASLETPFVYGQYRGVWYYLLCTDVSVDALLPKVKQFVLVVWAKDFHPEKYEILCRLLSRSYTRTGTPTSLLHLYLCVVTSGSCTTKENGTFLVNDFHPKKAYLASCIKNVINIFKLEMILIYTALILKKRIIVYHHQIGQLQNFLRALPAFVWHRQNWQILHPLEDNVESELAHLKSQPYYVAGFVDATVESKVDFYDLFVNLAAVEMTVPSHAKEAFGMSKIHKDIALFMVRLAEDATVTDEEAIAEISSRTNDLLNSLKALCIQRDGKCVITLELLKEKKLAPALETFLFNLAIAENMIALDLNN